MDLNQAVVLVTGSARGVGRAIAEGFAAKGSRVAMVDVLDDVLIETADALTQSGGTVLPIVADITIPEDVESMVETVQTTFGPIDVLVNNAGTFSVIGPVWEFSCGSVGCQGDGEEGNRLRDQHGEFRRRGRSTPVLDELCKLQNRTDAADRRASPGGARVWCEGVCRCSPGDPDRNDPVHHG